jgi:broad specificity phosphatase PhoE
MPNLILVRHSISRQQPGVSAHEWDLTDEGCARCLILAERLKKFQPEIIVTSPEPKAHQTAKAIADELSKPLEIEVDLQEHRRATATYFADEAEFRAKVHELLTRPDELIFGEETGTAAYQRFWAVIQSILVRHPAKNVIAVTHGTVMSLFVAQVAKIDPINFWQNLGMPAYVVLSLLDFQIVEIENSIASQT